jgi:hypothetical protein
MPEFITSTFAVTARGGSVITTYFERNTVMATKKKSAKSTSEFEEPYVDDASQSQVSDYDDDENAEAAAPPEAEMIAEAPEDAEADEAAPQAADNDVLNVKAEIEAVLCAGVEQGASGVQAMASATSGGDLIQGVGVGAPEFDMDQTSGDGPGVPVLNVYVAEPMTMEQTRRAIYDDFHVHAVGDDALPVNVHRTGMIDSQPHRHRARPSPCGISTGHFRITAGTLGCLARGRRAPRNARLLMLSNNHVLANSNNARFGDNIIQPGRADMGVNPRDRIAILERFVRIDFTGRPNLVDAATGWCWPNLVRREQIYRSGGAWRHFRISSTPRWCQQGLIVGKSGRTTQLTSGRVTGCNETIRVSYGAAGVAVFRNQIAIRGLRGDFSRGGDSGSIIWTWDSRRNPVGLLFAGGGGYTFANKIQYVLPALDINLYT